MLSSRPIVRPENRLGLPVATCLLSAAMIIGACPQPGSDDSGNGPEDPFRCESLRENDRLPLFARGPFADCDPALPPDPCDLFHGFDDVVIGRVEALVPGHEPIVDSEDNALDASLCADERVVPAIDVVLSGVTFLDPQVGAEETFLLRIGRFWWWWDDYSYEGGWIPGPEWSEGEVFWNDAPLHDERRADSLKEHVDRLHELGCEQGGPLVPGQTIAAGVIYSDSAPAVVAWPIWAVTGDGGEQGGGPGDFLLSSQPLFDTNSCAMFYQVFDEPVSLSYLRDLLETCEPESNVGDRLRTMVPLSDYHAALCE